MLPSLEAKARVASSDAHRAGGLREVRPDGRRRSRSEASFPVEKGFGDSASAGGQVLPDLLIFFFPREAENLDLHMKPRSF